MFPATGFLVTIVAFATDVSFSKGAQARHQSLAEMELFAASESHTVARLTRRLRVLYDECAHVNSVKEELDELNDAQPKITMLNMVCCAISR